MTESRSDRRNLANGFRVEVAPNMYRLHRPVFTWRNRPSQMEDRRRGVISQTAGPFATSIFPGKDYRMYIYD